MEILQFGLCDNLGGIETYIKKIHDNIDQSRFHFSFIDMTGENGHPAFEDEFKMRGCTFYKVSPRRVSIKQNRRDLEKLFTEHHFDVLHFNANTLSYIAPILIALKHGCNVIVHSHSVSSVGNKITKYLHIINSFRLRFCQVKRVAVSEPAGKWFFNKRAFIFSPNGVDTDIFRFSFEKRNKIRKTFECEDKLVIGQVATFIPVKNQAFTIEIFEQIKMIVPNAVMWFIGQGETMEQIKTLVHEKHLDDSVLFLGRRTDMPDLYCGMDAHILPSLYEGFPNVAMEAQAMGLPCLFSDCITKEIKVFESLDFMSLSETPEAWADKLLKMINTANIDRVNACKRIEEKGMSVKQEILRIEKLYAGIIEGR